MMIRTLHITNFKSIRELKLSCRRVNVFIGKPNTGKSNLLEALGMFSLPYSGNPRSLLRFETMVDLFRDADVSKGILVEAGEEFWKMEAEGEVFRCDSSSFTFSCHYSSPSPGDVTVIKRQPPIKFYRHPIPAFSSSEPGFLRPPDGRNLVTVLRSNRELARVVSGMLEEFNLKLVLKPYENKIELQRETDGVIISHPYITLSETLRRLIFYLAAIKTNSDSVLIFEEPEAQAFPFYTKYLAELIAGDTSNQYFISTHNPYMLLSLVEKTPKKEIKVFITRLEDHETIADAVPERKLSEILDLDAGVFFNLESLGGGR